MIITNSTMQLDHFNDFYLLEALGAEITRQIAQDPRLEFSHSVDKLRNDILEHRYHLIPNLALRTFVYLYAACLGEARHAAEPLAKSLFIFEFRGGDRSDVFDHITEYAPSKENIKKLIQVYEQSWRGSFGGKAWGNIARALLMYLEQTPESFIDHVIDLEHNNGTVFSKNESLLLKMKLKYVSCNFKKFLNYKFEKDMLRSTPPSDLAVSRKTHALLRRYAVIFRNELPLKWFMPVLDNLGDYEVKWGNRQLDLQKKWANWVDVRQVVSPNAENLLNFFRMQDIYVHQYTQRGLMRHLLRIRAKAKYVLARNRTRLSLMGAINKYFERNKQSCKLPKDELTYSAIPVTYKVKNKKLVILLPVKASTLASTDYGSAYIGPTEFIAHQRGHSLGLNGRPGYIRALLIQGGSCPQLKTSRNNLYLPHAKKMEVILR